MTLSTLFKYFFILLTHEGSHREEYQESQPSYDIFRRSSAKLGCLDHGFRARTPSLHWPIALLSSSYDLILDFFFFHDNRRWLRIGFILVVLFVFSPSQSTKPDGGVPYLITEGKVGAGILDNPGNPDSTVDNIPLRIILLFMDEVFDLRERNQWLRRQIVAVLRQILKAMFGTFEKGAH